jgi:hypothetical protein
LDRALVSGTKGRGFNSRIARHSFAIGGTSIMKKWIGLLLSLLLIIGVISYFISSHRLTIPGKAKGERFRMIQTQGEKGNKKGEADSHFLQMLKEIQKNLEGWLKSLNERIESEDITRFEVRFLEILRNILEWIKEKIDAKIESYEGEKTQKKGKGVFQETHQERFVFSEMG